jgi:serine/threonine protein kinase
MGHNIFNPLYALENFFKKQIKCCLGPIHGDLHPRNIIIDDNDIPHLIDFKWANPKGHLALDFVLLEVSLRFFLLPRGYNLMEHFLVNKYLVEENGYKKIQMPSCGCPILKRYHELLGMAIGKIRTSAKEVIGEKYFTEYLACMFLVLYGVLRIKHSDKILGVHALSSIADVLKNI